ncbi:DUF2207 domain-containing protein [Pelotomaculum propionicicum]|uniref:DUF2207 domain-containing protein n=1 Tax=Pelotomaculum propionicicum TaxID=258475 RepID=UPI003B7EF518
MKKISYILGFVLLLVMLPSMAYAQDYTITNFSSEITVSEDSSIMVRETIDVYFPVSKHGIYREIPYKFKDDLGGAVITPLKVVSVRNQTGAAWKYQVNKNGNIINIKIGDAKKYVSGAQTYVITYKVENALLFLEDHDQLYWNVTGNYWNAPIKKASAVVALAVKGQSKVLKAVSYNGLFGSDEQGGYEAVNNSGKFYSTRSLNTGEGLTIVFGWDKGLVSPPSALQIFLWKINFRENWVFIFPIIAVLLMTGLWYRTGRDPKVRDSVAVMYEPPKANGLPLSPAEVGTIIDERIDQKDITSSIVGLAVKGYIKIEEINKDVLVFKSRDYNLVKVKEPGTDLSVFESLLMDRVFSGKPSILVSDMKNSFYKHLPGLRDALNKELVSKKYFGRNPETVKSYYYVVGVLSFLLVLLVGMYLQKVINSYYPAGPVLLAAALTGVGICAFAGAMPAKTRAGAAAHMEVLGFREFLNRAEKDRLERMGDSTLFSRFLPYAMALGVADNWSKAFEGIYQEQPEWYVSPFGVGMFNAHVFSSSVGSMASSVGSAMFSAPRGSGSGGFGGGGGFSGGGFGGGGGGSW